MIDIQQKFAAAQQALGAGDTARAVALLESLVEKYPEQPAVHHRLGLALKQRGRLEDARRIFETAIERHPAIAALHAELASLLDDLGESEAAILAYDRALAIEPGLVDARIDRALVRQRDSDPAAACRELREIAAEHPGSYRAQLNFALAARSAGNIRDAAEAVARALAISPDSFGARLLDAQLALNRGRPAVAAFREARRIDPENHSAIAGEASALIAEGQREAAGALIEAALSKNPEWGEGLGLLAQIRWQSGEGEDFARGYREAVGRAPHNPALWYDYATATARALGHERALPIYEEARRAIGDDAYLGVLHANSLSEVGRMEDADARFSESIAREETVFRLPLIRHCLRAHRFELARDYGTALIEAGYGPEAWPYVGIAWRALEDPRWLWLEGDRDLAAAFDLDDLIPDLAALAERLRGFHRWNAHPIEQSLRGGTQTDDILFAHAEPEIRSLVGHIRATVSDYISELPPEDPWHPVLSPPRDDFHFSGSWSVRLTDGGFHVNHVHNAGWISSAFYVSLPDILDSHGDEHAGWLALGEPPAELGLNLGPIRMIEPKPGRLVLFPSIMWHGTRPFRSGERLTVAFDVAAR